MMPAFSLRLPALGLASLAALTLSGCETTLPASGPVTVTRFHIPQQVAAGDIAIVPGAGTDPQSLEYQSDLAPVSVELARLGYRVVAPGPGVPYLAEVDVTRGSRMAPPRRSPVTIGIGGGFGTGGYHSGGGLGGGVAFPVGGDRAGPELVGTQLSVKLRRRADSTVYWEGRAFSEARADAPEAASPATAVPRLAAALFQGFPGDSGRTITVK